MEEGERTGSGAAKELGKSQLNFFDCLIESNQLKNE
jgi:hypothetical protein